jgi:protoporphyrinogen oxidase
MKINNIAVIGAGVSGLSMSHCLKKHFRVKVFESDARPGGLIKCDRVEGHIYHKVGGHVFNSKRQDVLDWFWNFFDRQKEFVQTSRNATIALFNEQLIDYPIDYAKNNGSQFLADRLAEGLNISFNVRIDKIKHAGTFWDVNGEKFDKIVFCGNIKDLPEIMHDNCLDRYKYFIDNLAYHGTTTVLCEIERNPYTWIYLPDKTYSAHRIICTGNFSPNNNHNGKMTATVEFTDELSKRDIDAQLNKIPFSPKYITHHYTPCTYPIQNADTRKTIHILKEELKKENFYLSGRFAEWEYYNMDAAMGAAIDLSKQIIK